MELSIIRDKLYDIVEPVVSGLQFKLVEIKHTRREGSLFISIVVFGREGVGINDCSRLYKTILPRVELFENSRDIHLEVASPGLSRELKTHEEFHIFQGKGVKVLIDFDKKWERGIIASATGNSVFLEKNKSSIEIPYNLIRKAKLEYSRGIK